MAPAPPTPTTVPATSSHMMKVTKRGRPFLKDTLDLFATLVVSLQLKTNKQYFKTHPNSFTTDDAAANLASLKFSQSNRGPDPREPSRIVTTTTTTTFSMTRDMAKAMCQHFMDARLIENAADPGSNLFKDRGVYILTPKGLHVLERFISKNGINSEHLGEVFRTQPICIKLLHLERRNADDEIIVTQNVITALFRRFVGKHPNYPPATGPSDIHEEYHQRAKGIALSDITERSGPFPNVRGQGAVTRHCFAAVSALEWLCDFTSVVGREEAAEMAAQFVRFGLIHLVSDKRKNNDSAIIFTVRGSAQGGSAPVSQQGEFRCTAKAIYKITDEGRRLAGWEGVHRDSPTSSTAHLPLRPSTDNATEAAANSSGETRLQRRVSVADRMNGNQLANAEAERRTRESNTERLRLIVEEPPLRGAFRDFLRSNFCEENLAFWLAVQEFKRRFNITSSASAVNTPTRYDPRTGRPIPVNTATPTGGAMERHHEQLIQTAVEIYNTYLARSSQCELNIDHNLRTELAQFLGGVLSTGQQFVGRLEPDQAAVFNATQLQRMINIYDGIQSHVFKLMATDSVPKFIKTPKFKELRQGTDDDEWDNLELAVPPGLGGDEVGRAYMTVSTKGSEQRTGDASHAREH